VFFMYAPATRVIYSLSLHDALPILAVDSTGVETKIPMDDWIEIGIFAPAKEGEKKREILYKKMHHLDAETKTIIVNVSNEPGTRSEEHTSELQSRENLVCRLLLEKK